MMKTVFVGLACLAVTACTYVPPESVAPISEVCSRYGMKVIVTTEMINCYKHGDK